METTIGFIDDADFELEAFKATFGNDYTIVTSKKPEEFIARLGAEDPKPRLLLFDLYFALREPPPGPPLNRNELAERIAPFTAASEAS